MNDDYSEDFEGFESGAQTDLVDGKFYPATLTGFRVIRIKSKWPEFPDGTARAVEWQFATESGETVNGVTSMKLGRKSTAYGWIAALLGTESADYANKHGVPKGQLVGRECTIVIAINDNGYPKVSGVLAAQERQNAPEPAKKVEVDSEPTDEEPPLPESSGAPWDAWANKG